MRIPADVDREDPLILGLSARQLCILAAGGAIAWLLYAVVRAMAPVPIAVAAAAPLMAVGAWAALGGRDGISGDRFALAMLRHLRSPHRLVLMSDDQVPAHAMRSFDGRRLAPLELPIGAITDDGRVDLGPDGAATIARVDPINFTLRAEDEQAALVAGFARFLNSLHEPIQIIVRSERADLGPLAAEVRSTAPSLPHPALEGAARSHAAFLGELSQHHTVLRREVLLVARTRTSEARDGARSRTDAMCAALAEAGLVASRLDGRGAADALQHALTGEPLTGELSSADEVIRGHLEPA